MVIMAIPMPVRIQHLVNPLRLRYSLLAIEGIAPANRQPMVIMEIPMPVRIQHLVNPLRLRYSILAIEGIAPAIVPSKCNSSATFGKS